VPNCLFLEFHAMGISWWSDMCDGDKPFIEDGFMAVSERPGIGVELNADACKKLMYKGDTYFD
jgi:L-alanine-DL-glutamate epimerase-like enolase superfamily enzyme